MYSGDALTRREREVLDLLRLGLTNEEIAQRLGITLDGAKYHVSQILSKLGVATRDEAAAIALEPRRRWWAAWPGMAKIAGAATMTAAVAGLVLLAWGATRADIPEEQTTNVTQTDAPRVGATAIPEPTPIPWVDAAPGPTPAVPIPTYNPDDLAVRACEAADLQARLLSRFSGLGTTHVRVGFANVSASGCRVQGIPGVALYEPSGSFLPIEALPGLGGCSANGCPPVVLSPSGQVLPERSEGRPGQAILELVFGQGAHPPCPDDTAAFVGERITLGEAGGAIDIPVTDQPLDGPPFDRPFEGYRICYPVGLSQFKIDQDPPSLPPPPLRVSLELPGAAVHHEPLEFVVVLTNSSQERLKLDEPCPNYDVWIESALLGAYALNCVPVGTLEPGASAKFQMIMDLSALDRDPENERSLVLVWSLDRWQAAASGQIDVVWSPRAPFDVSPSNP